MSNQSYRNEIPFAVCFDYINFVFLLQLAAWSFCMASFLSRTPMTAPAANGRPSVGLSGDMVRKVRDNSPLQVFVNAKRKINDIYVEIEDYIRDGVSYMRCKKRASFLVQSS